MVSDGHKNALAAQGVNVDLLAQSSCGQETQVDATIAKYMSVRPHTKRLKSPRLGAEVGSIS